MPRTASGAGAAPTKRHEAYLVYITRNPDPDKLITREMRDHDIGWSLFAWDVEEKEEKQFRHGAEFFAFHPRHGVISYGVMGAIVPDRVTFKEDNPPIPVAELRALKLTLPSPANPRIRLSQPQYHDLKRLWGDRRRAP